MTSKFYINNDSAGVAMPETEGSFRLPQWAQFHSSPKVKSIHSKSLSCDCSSDYNLEFALDPDIVIKRMLKKQIC